MMKVLEGLRAKKTHRQIAVDIFGVREVKAKWYTDGGMRSQVRQWIAKAKAHGRGRRAGATSCPAEVVLVSWTGGRRS